MSAPAWLPSPDHSVLPVASTMDWRNTLLFSLYVACLVGILCLLLLVASKHNTPGKSTNSTFGETPAWQFRIQETSLLLTWVSALAFGVLSLCSQLEVIESEDFSPNTILFLATAFGHMTMLCDIMLLFFHRLRPRYWGFAAAMILMLDSTSVIVTAVVVKTKGRTLVPQILPPILTTLIDGSIAATVVVALGNTGGFSSATRHQISISAMLRHLHIVPLWIWPFLSTEDSSVGVSSCQNLQMLILVYPWCYSPLVLYGRWRRRGSVAKGQSDKQAGSQTDCSESTWELVPHNTQGPVPMMPASIDAKTEPVGRGDLNCQV